MKIKEFVMDKKKLELTLAVLIVVSLILSLINYLFLLSENQRIAIYVLDFIVVIFLGADFYHRLKASNEGLRFILRHWYEIPAMLPLIIFDIHAVGEGPLRILLLITFFRLIRLYRILTFFADKNFVFLAVFTALNVIFGGIGVYLAESQHQGANINKLKDAFWWATATVTTVGYGDFYPVTLAGRILAAVLMFSGIAIFGLLVHAIAHMLTKSRSTSKNKVQSELLLLGGGSDDDTKTVIKNKIDEIEDLTQQDFDTLLIMIKGLRHTLLEDSKSQHQCSRCSNVNHGKANFCSNCGFDLR